MIIKKEIRENIFWMIIPLAIHLFSIFSRLDTRSYRGYSIPIVDGNFLSLFALISYIFAAAIGLFQTMSEEMRGTYQFLFHRPSSRTKIFFSKIFAGALLYLVSCLPPVILMIHLSKNPQSFGTPYRTYMSYPLIILFLNGFIYYLAGFLTGIRTNAKWWGTRLAGLAAAIGLSFVIITIPQFYKAIIISVMLSIIMLWACYVVFINREY